MLLIAGRHRIRICQPDRAPSTTAVAQSNLPPAVIDHVAASHLYSFQSFCCRASVMLTLSLSWQMMIVFRKNEKHSSRFAKKAFSHLLSLEIDGRAPSIPAAKTIPFCQISLGFIPSLSWQLVVSHTKMAQTSPVPPGQRAQLDSQSTQTETGHDVIMPWFTQCVRIRIDRWD